MVVPERRVAFAVSRGGAFHAGRAGMQYRDLIPDRLGGWLIASHIRIPDGGPVPDYVHHHAIAVQIIYVRAGWVRVVYEDQGEPFVMQAGDCVVQPPGIRHRVLEASVGLEVIELASPAAHATFADRALGLPNGTRARTYSDQRFHWHRASEGDDLGLAAPTNGRVRGRIARGPFALQPRDVTFGFVLDGEIRIADHVLGRDDAFVAPPARVESHGGGVVLWMEM
jgi:mannose-6-phosphate isomerase-like protein (cupin superfamily)